MQTIREKQITTLQINYCNPIIFADNLAIENSAQVRCNPRG